MNRLKKHAAALKTISQAKPALANAIIKHADKELIDTLCECCLNVAKGRVPLSKSQKTKLGKHKIAIRKLISKETSTNKRKKILQRGGFIGPITSLLMPLVGRVLGL